MAMLFSRCRNVSQSCLWKHIIPSMAGFQCLQPVSTEAQQRPVENHMDRNIRLKRPLSPHLTIYKFEITSVLSITHRMTGLIMSAGLYGLSLGMLALPSSFPYYMNYMQSLSIMSPVLYSLKFALAWMVFYHTANGVRHLAWDLGYGFELKNLYMSGYAVLGTSVALAAITAAL